MKVAILTNRLDSFSRPMAQGLARMLAAVGARGDLFYDGLRLIRRLPTPAAKYALSHCFKALRQKTRGFLLKRLIDKLKGYDVVVVVESIPMAYLRDTIDDALLRSELAKTPLVLYDVAYLPTRGKWSEALKIGNPELGIPGGGHYGIERFDWYLCASVVSEFPLPGGPQPYSHIGINFDDGALFPSQNGRFLALIDFERPAHMAERSVQIEALRETDTPFIELKGRYTMAKIRQIYRQCSLYFVAHRESFGLPICELQACGAFIFTPYAAWCPSHWIKEDLHQPGPGVFSDNIVVYDNDKSTLKREILRIKKLHDPEVVRQRFLSTQPELFHGSLKDLQSFLDRVREGVIHGGAH